MAEHYRCATCGNMLSDAGGQLPRVLLKEGLAEPSAGPLGQATVAYQSQPPGITAGRTEGLPSPGQDFGLYHIVRRRPGRYGFGFRGPGAG